jgi:hypothetical protein
VNYQSTPLIGERAEPERLTYLRVRSRRVFILRTWLGIKIMRLGFAIAGSIAETIE